MVFMSPKNHYENTIFKTLQKFLSDEWVHLEIKQLHHFNFCLFFDGINP